eukprot:9422424-Ditylum_brightwellii.AAC.2
MQTLLTINGLLYPKSSMARLYLHQSKGGQGLTDVKDTHTEKCSTLAKYVIKSNDPITKIIRDTPSPTQKHLMHYASAP